MLQGLFTPFELPAGAGEPWIEFFTADHAVAVGVDQAVYRAARLFDLLL